MQSRRERDPRLDFFRGLAMLIIFVAHVRGNSWTQFIPARFGFSSAAEMFVFCSGYASALAFGSVYVEQDWRVGTTRILRRIWQLYCVHVGLFVSLAVISIVATGLGFAIGDAALEIGLGDSTSDRLTALAALLALSYVPDLLNILPMYVVLLAFVPLMMTASTISPLLPIAASAALWGLVQAIGLNLPAGGAPSRMWFFDPFAWQLMFFTGFALGMRWLLAPRLNHPALPPLSIAVIALSIPINFWGFTDNVPALASARAWLVPDGIAATTRLHLLRYAHFLCLAYVALSLLNRWPKALASRGAAPILVIGRQSLAAFVSSVVFAWIAGIALDTVGHGFLAVAIVNLAGFAAIFAVARLIARLKLSRPRLPLQPASQGSPVASGHPLVNPTARPISEARLLDGQVHATNALRSVEFVRQSG
jgi:hypothetical protein